MKFAEINTIFTQKVAEYINKGYTFNSNTMSGTQGEIAKVDLRKGTEVIRVRLDTITHECRPAVVLIVGRNTDERIANNTERNGGWYTMWNGKLEVIEERTFWQMQKNFREVDWYIEGDAGKEAIKKTDERLRKNYLTVEHPDRIFEGVEKVIAKAVRRHLERPGFKAQNVKKVWKTWNANEGRYIFKVQTLKHTIVLG